MKVADKDFPAIAYFVTSHGLGHAARACAVMQALYLLKPAIRFEIFTDVPAWIFQQSLSVTFRYHPLKTDVGLVQSSPFSEDVAATRQRLAQWLPFDRKTVQSTARRISRLACQAVVCDIAPFGIAVAESAKLPSLLVENFTWDWIYEGYRELGEKSPDLLVYLAKYYSKATFRVQTEPVCRRAPDTLKIAPIGRRPRTEPDEIRRRLNIPTDRKMVLVTMGGVPDNSDYTAVLQRQPDICFVLPGGGSLKQTGNLVQLPLRSAFYHPDLIAASDAVVGKAGYSTMAEAYYAAKPYGYIARASFPESACLKTFIEQRMAGLEISHQEMITGTWIQQLPKLLQMQPAAPRHANGADQAAALLLKYLPGVA